MNLELGLSREVELENILGELVDAYDTGMLDCEESESLFERARIILERAGEEGDDE